MFGQSEINDTANLRRFGDCMVGVASDMRNDLGEPDLPFVVGDWEEGARGSLTTTSSTGRAVIPQMRMLPMRIPRSVLIPTDGLPMNPLDGQHYDLTGYKHVGRARVRPAEDERPGALDVGALTDRRDDVPATAYVPVRGARPPSRELPFIRYNW